MFRTMRNEVHYGRLSGKNPDHSIITKTCQKRPFFDFDQILTENRDVDFSGKFFLWNYRVLGVSPRKPHIREESGYFFKKFSVRRVYAFWPFWMIHMGFGQFLAFRSRFGLRIDSILHILIELNGAHELAMISLMLDHSKFTKMPFWMIQIAKNEVFGHFLEFGGLERHDVAYFDRTKWS